MSEIPLGPRGKRIYESILMVIDVEEDGVWFMENQHPIEDTETVRVGLDELSAIYEAIHRHMWPDTVDPAKMALKYGVGKQHDV